MSETGSLTMIRKMFLHLSNAHRWQIVLLCIISFFASLAEIVSIASVIPFLALVSGEKSPMLNDMLQRVGLVFDFSEGDQITSITLIFISTVLVAAAIKILMHIFLTNLAAGIGANYGYKLFASHLSRSFLLANMSHSSDALAAVNKTIELVEQFIRPIFVMISSSFLMISITSLVVILEPMISISVFIGLSGIYLFIAFYLRPIVKRKSNFYSQSHDRTVRLLQEGLGSTRDIIINGQEKFYTDRLLEILVPMHRSLALIKILAGIPRHVIEAFGISVICFLVLFFNSLDHGIAEVIPILGFLALAMHRTLPLMQQTYSSYTSVQGAMGMVKDVLFELERYEARHYGSQSVSFEKSIVLKEISFKYPNAKTNVLDCYSLTIQKGNKLGLWGHTGSGKSTILDILSGLIEPQLGAVFIDGTPLNSQNRLSWMSRLAYVSQSIFLLDRPLLENICSNIDEELINYEHLQACLMAVDLEAVVRNLNNGLRSSIGERGALLSGGQKQKIGIARALYRKPDLLILDEATNAMDAQTESKVMKGIAELFPDITLILVSHSKSTMKFCDAVVNLNSVR